METIQVKIEKQTKKEFENYVKKIGSTCSTYLRQYVIKLIEENKKDGNM